MAAPISRIRALFLGAAWAVAQRWALRLLGLLSTVIMARLLIPNDYGIVAMAMLVVGLLQALLDFGTRTALLRKREVSVDEIDSAWTLGVIQGWLIAIVLTLVSPIAGAYFGEPRVVPVMWILAACCALAGYGNIGFALAQKAYDFALEFRYLVICKLIGVVATIIGGLWFADYRALVLGVSAGYVSGVVFSFLMHPYRPQWNIKQIPAIWATTKWLMLASAATFVVRKGDELIAGRVGTTDEFGAYNVGADLGQMPAGEVGPAMLKAFMPVLSTVAEDSNSLNWAVIRTLSALATVVMPIGFGFASVSGPATILILGSAWDMAVPFVAAFAIVGAIQSVFQPLNTLLVVKGHTKAISRLVWVELAIFLATATLLVPGLHLLGLIYARGLACICSGVLLLAYSRSVTGFPMGAGLMSIVRPLLGAIAMAYAVEQVVQMVVSPIASITLGVSTGVLLYTFWSILTWQLQGRPDGLESIVLTHASKLRERLNLNNSERKS